MNSTIDFGTPGQHVFVTGGTGFIGQELVRALLAQGQHVTVLTRNPTHAIHLFDGKVACVNNLNELDSHTKFDVIINLAGARILGWRWSEKRKATLRQSRVALTEQLVAWIRKAEHKPRLLLSASAIGYYGIQEKNDASSLDEDSPAQAIFMSQLCQEWEAAAQQASAYGVQVACMRFGLVLGKQGALPMMLLPIKLGLGGKLGRGDQWHSWIHIHDLIRGMAHLCKLNNALADEEKSSLHNAYNFTAPETLSQLEFTHTAAKVLHRPSIFPTPGWPMRLMMGEQADLLLEGQRVVPRRLLESGFVFAYPSLKEALESLV